MTTIAFSDRETIKILSGKMKHANFHVFVTIFSKITSENSERIYYNLARVPSVRCAIVVPGSKDDLVDKEILLFQLDAN